MKKPKNKAKRMSDLKRASKRNERLKESRKKVAKKRQTAIIARVEERRKFNEFMNKLQDARGKSEL